MLGVEGSQGSDDRARIRHGGRSGSARGQGHHRNFADQGGQCAFCHPSGGRPLARAHERIAGRGQCSLRHRFRNG